MGRHFLTPKRLHSLFQLFLILLQHFLQFLLPNRHFFALIAYIKCKRNRNGDIELFIMWKCILISNLKDLIFLPLDALLFHNFVVLVITGSRFIGISVFLSFPLFFLLDDSQLPLQVLYVNSVLNDFWSSSIRQKSPIFLQDPDTPHLQHTLWSKFPRRSPFLHSDSTQIWHSCLGCVCIFDPCTYFVETSILPQSIQRIWEFCWRLPSRSQESIEK
jgi:hypothetical protein